MTSLRSPLWRRLQDVLFVYLCCSHLLCFLAPVLAAGARLADFECQYKCQTVRVFFFLLDRKLWAAGVPGVSYIQGVELIAKVWQETDFSMHFQSTRMSWLLLFIFTMGRMVVCVFLFWLWREEKLSKGLVSWLARARRNNQTLWGPAACLAQELRAVPQPALPAYSNIYDNFLAGESNWTSICYLAN